MMNGTVSIVLLNVNGAKINASYEEININYDIISL
jgi:hypothetical protein